MSDYRVERALDIRAELGEHPIWSVEDQCLYWLDIQSATINRFDPRAVANTAWRLPAMPGCFAFREGGGAIIAARDGLYDIDFSTGAIKPVLPAPHDPQIMRFNDGRTDRQGRLWAGTVRVDMDLTNTVDNAYYRYDGEHFERVLSDVGITNGTAFSPDGKTMYRAQTETRQIFAYDYDTATGAPSNERVFVDVPGDYGMPDGATVDSEGGYWVALAEPPGGRPTGGIARFAPDGRLDLFIGVPVPFVTMMAFGGPDLSMLYITTARLEAFMPGKVPAGAGDIFAVETPFRGVPEVAFRAG
jgi:sugar lactone lactonase YvrE